MAEVISTVEYVLKLTAKEYAVVTQALARLGDVAGMGKVVETDKALATSLNRRLLETQAADYRTRLDFTERKIAKLTPADDLDDDRQPVDLVDDTAVALARIR